MANNPLKYIDIKGRDTLNIFVGNELKYTFDDGRTEVTDYHYTNEEWQNRSVTPVLLEEAIIQGGRKLFEGHWLDVLVSLRIANGKGQSMDKYLTKNVFNDRYSDLGNLIKHSYSTYNLSRYQGSNFARKIGEVREVNANMNYDNPVQREDSEMDLINNNLGIEISENTEGVLGRINFLEKVLQKVEAGGGKVRFGLKDDITLLRAHLIHLKNHD